MSETEKVVENGSLPFGIDYSRLAKAAIVLSGSAIMLAAMLAATSAKAQASPGYANDFSRPYGLSSPDMILPYDATTRDSAGNRTIIDGVYIMGSTLDSTSIGQHLFGNGGSSFSGTGYAIGNQLNVTTTGNFNTVIVNSNQVNNGDQTVIINGTGCSTCASTNSTSATEVLNGGLNF